MLRRGTDHRLDVQPDHAGDRSVNAEQSNFDFMERFDHRVSHLGSQAEQYVHSVFAIGETASSDKTIEFKDVFKMLSTRPIQVHQPFTIEIYALDWSVQTTEYDMATSTYKVATAHNKLRPVKDIQTGTIADDKFMTFTFEYEEYDTAPRTH